MEAILTHIRAFFATFDQLLTELSREIVQSFTSVDEEQAFIVTYTSPHISTRMQMECLLHLSLIKGTRLPSTDFLSKIDACVKVKVLTGAAAAGQATVESCRRQLCSDLLLLLLPMRAGQWSPGRADACGQ